MSSRWVATAPFSITTVPPGHRRRAAQRSISMACGAAPATTCSPWGTAARYGITMARRGRPCRAPPRTTCTTSGWQVRALRSRSEIPARSFATTAPAGFQSRVASSSRCWPCGGSPGCESMPLVGPPALRPFAIAPFRTRASVYWTTGGCNGQENQEARSCAQAENNGCRTAPAGRGARPSPRRRDPAGPCASVFPRSSSQSGEADAPQDLLLALLVNHMRRQPHASVPLLSRDAVTRRLRVERNAIGFEERRHERLDFILARDRLGNAAEDRAGP